jgi:hypothetical protein
MGSSARADRASLGRAIHDLHARLGSIRMAVTAVAALELDAETEASMLTTASEESVRAAAELSAIGALTTCLLDGPGEVGAHDVAAELEAAAEAARLAGFEIDVTADGPALAAVPLTAFRTVAPSLLRLASGAGGSVTASVHRLGDRVHVLFRRDGEDTEAMPPVGLALVDAIGARPEPPDGLLQLSWASA